MIVRRSRRQAKAIPKRIVRRTKQSVGRQRSIVRRQRGGAGRPPRTPWYSTFLGWRPGKWFIGSAAGLAVIAAIGTAGYGLYHSPFFEVSRVEVHGNELVSTRAIVERANLHGERMFTADLAAAQRSVYAIPVLSSVQVERKWPDTIVVRVEERQPWGTWEQGGVSYTIDREGVVISSTEPPPPGSPVIVSSEIGSRQLGDRVDYQAVDAAAEIYELLPQELGTTVTEVAFLSGKGVQVTTGNGQVALFGDSSGIAYKLAVWAAVSTAARADGIEYSVIDLRYGNRPVLQ
jgi:cell division protein FtsQ